MATKAKKKSLTARQKATMKNHSQHHTSAHMREMTKMMLAGSTFTAAHKKAMKKVGRQMAKRPGLYRNIAKKRARIKAGSGERMRSAKDPKAPTNKAFKESAKTAKKRPAKKKKK